MMPYILILIVLIIIYVVRIKIPSQKYWLKRGVKHGSILPFFGDSLGTFLRTESFTELIKRLYFKHPNERYMGCYHMTKPTLLVRDPKLIKTIMVKDFDYFTDHRNFTSDKNDKLWSKNLFFLKGDEWKAMRTTLTPAFTTIKMKAMFPLISSCAKNCSKYFEEGDDLKSVEFKDIFRRVANDIIANCGFGLQCDSLRDKNNEFYLRGREVTNFGSIKRKIKFYLFLLAPKICQILDLKIFSNDLGNFFIKLVDRTIKDRIRNDLSRPDMIQLLMEVNKDQMIKEIVDLDRHNGIKLSVEDITAQVLIFFFAGFDTVSTLMSFMAYELALNPLIQKKLQIEIDKIKEEHLRYDDLKEMKYMEMVIQETLRKWPSAVFLDRVCVKPYILEPEGDNEKPLQILKGDVVWFPIFGLHHDPNYFSSPEVFNPERFNESDRCNIKPFTFLPFGEGPRSCLASRFVIMETKLIFYYLLRSFDLTTIKKTSIPFKIDKKQFNLGAENGFWLGLRKRKLL